MSRIVFSPLVATRFLRYCFEGRSFDGRSFDGRLHAAGEVGSGEAAGCHGEIERRNENRLPRAQLPTPTLPSAAVARHVLQMGQTESDLEPERFESLVSRLAESLTPGASAETAQGWLEQIHEDLDCEWIEPGGVASGYWVLRARGARELYPAIDLIAEALARRDIHVGARLPALGHAQALARASACLGRDFSGTRVRVGFVRGHLLELAFAVPGCFGHADEQALEAATIYAEAALGEERLDEWVGSIGVSPAPRGGGLRVLDSAGQGSAVTPLAELSTLVHAGIRGLCGGLPEAPLGSSSASDWTLLDAQPLTGEDGAPSSSGMDDTLMASTRCPELLKCFLEGLPVSSRRFSRVGETFAYLKLPSAAPLAQRPEERALVEQAVEPCLGEHGVLIGNAVGLRHSYIVLALRSLDPALEALIACAAANPELFPRGSELRFLDAAWADEWLRLR
ncbi:MAG: hypothetical protein AB7S68_33705 [Polyangiaceae bacterium]